MKVVLFVKNFSKEYITYLISKIPTSIDIYINYNDYYVNFTFSNDIYGFIYGSKEDESYERVRFNYIIKDEPTSLDIDDVNYFFHLK